jgi:hypothetical protein
LKKINEEKRRKSSIINFAFFFPCLYIPNEFQLSQNKLKKEKVEGERERDRGGYDYGNIKRK